MSKYTMSIKELIEHNVNIFDFDFNFYDDDYIVKNNFIQKFLEHYYYYEIAFEEVDMFKHFLKGKLNLHAPYWKQLYQTELRCNDIDFMLNKDLKETFTRELTNNENNERITSGTTNDTSNINVTLTDQYNENSSSKNQNSSIDNGLSSVELAPGYLTNVNDSTNSNEYNLEERNTGLNTNESESNFTNTENKEGNINEKTEFISQGNIGVTSSAELLEKWRKVLINLDLMIIQELSSLFLKIY